MHKSRIVYPHNFPHADLAHVLLRIAETHTLYEQRRQWALELLSIHGNTQSAVARTLDMTPQAVNAMVAKHQQTGTTP